MHLRSERGHVLTRKGVVRYTQGKTDRAHSSFAHLRAVRILLLQYRCTNPNARGSEVSMDHVLTMQVRQCNSDLPGDGVEH